MLGITLPEGLRRKIESTPRQEWSKNGKYVLMFQDPRKQGFSQTLMELYMNLVFVALLGNLTSIFNVCGTNFTSFRRAFEEFLIFYNFRMHLSEFACRFFANTNKISRFLHVMGTLGLFIMACFSQSQQQSSDTDGTDTCSLDDTLLYGYVSGFLIARISLLCLYLTSTAFNTKASIQFSYIMYTQVFVIVYVAIAFIYYVIQSVDESNIYVSYMFIIPSLVELVCRVIQPFVRRVIYQPGTIINFYPVNVYDIQHRLHEYILIIIGEAFVSLISVSPIDGPRGRMFIFLTCSFILLCSMGRIYRGVVDRKGKEHALHRSKAAGVIWLAMHLLTGYALFIVSCALKRCYQQVVIGEPINFSDSRLLSISCALSVVGCSILRALHKGVIGLPISVRKEKRKTRFIVYTFHALTAASHGLVTLTSQSTLDNFADSQVDYIIIIHMLVSCFFNIAERVANYYSRNLDDMAISNSPSIVSNSHDEIGFRNPIRVVLVSESMRYASDNYDNEEKIRIEEKEGKGYDEENRYSKHSGNSSWKMASPRSSDISDFDSNSNFLVTAEDIERIALVTNDENLENDGAHSERFYSCERFSSISKDEKESHGGNIERNDDSHHGLGEALLHS